MDKLLRWINPRINSLPFLSNTWICVENFFIKNHSLYTDFLSKAIQKLLNGILTLKKLNLRILIFILIMIIYLPPTFAMDADQSDLKISEFQTRVVKNISKKFCNSIGFGLSKESSIRFAVIENNKEFAKNRLFEMIDIPEVMNQTSTKIVDSCGFRLDLYGQEGVNEFQDYLKELEYLNK
tara:strand:- start:3515 stop:4057 length:543 start_codon:yes stop_codon:yes gene_type:complete